ncbi:hypothetical protein [Pandoraea commovens]|uniref:Uncharacterized protein n=1 Tax=Pandoraea commovens TaxID=2508289 RepID=A0A5E4RJU4_9BURK|nr:hypothetical protein [Pandoraea commovens]VVD62784.1 hypothetical protein PCO31010_00195 [Pandoraea commovens]
MTSRSITWFSVERGDISKALVGASKPASSHADCATPLNGPASEGDLAVGFSKNDTGVTFAAVAVVDRVKSDDLFAWLATYSPDVFPISQYVRLLDHDEFRLSEQIPASASAGADTIWPSLILGELLAQGGNPESGITAVPLSRVQFCHGFTAARVSALFRSDSQALRVAADRIELLEKAEKRWRMIGVDVLRMTWALAEDTFGQDAFTRELVSLLSWTFERLREQRGAQPALPEELQAISLNLRKLASGPLEYRVEEFERATSVLLANSHSLGTVAHARLPALLAALALWVGTGTGHVSLLAEVAEKQPATYAWFGAFAGALGPTYWHADWARTTAAISKQLRNGFDIAAPSTADLAWTEFAWLLSVGQFDLLSRVPRVSAKVVSVDVLPGAPASFRLSSDEGHAAHGDAPRVEPALRSQPKLDVQAPSAVAVRTGRSASGSLLPEQMDVILKAVASLSSLVNDARRPQPDVSDDKFELKPPPAATKKTSVGRKTSRKTNARK